MIRSTDGSFWLSAVFVVAALGLAYAVVTRDEVPLVGTGTLALLAVAVIGMAGCAVGGIAQAPTVGWSSPVIIVGSVLGIAALVVMAAGLFGWTALLDPIAGVVPTSGAPISPVRIATFGLAVIIFVKWLIAIAMAVVAH